MKILSVHNYYQQPGGEDLVFASEAAMLENYGQRVIRYEEHNSRIERSSALIAGIGAVWNAGSRRTLSAIVAEHRPDVAHFHNTFPLVSPAGYYAAREHRVPVVQELQNFRLLCPGATFLRDGKVCEQCVERDSFLPALIHRCYRGSRSATAAVSTMVMVHRIARTWQRMIDMYIAPSAFVRQKFVDNGFSPDRIAVKPNPISPDPGRGSGSGRYALFVGRLSEEKGIRTLAKAWSLLENVPLIVAGDGPLKSITWVPGVRTLGMKTRKEIFGLMAEASVLIVPSTWYETGPLTIIEAFACGLPVIASDIGSMAERVKDRQTGLLFRPGDAEDLARQVRWAFDHPEELRRMRVAARLEFEQKYTAERNYKSLIEIYQMAIENARRRKAGLCE